MNAKQYANDLPVTLLFTHAPKKNIIVHHSIGLTKSTLEFWRQISKSGGGALLISRKILMLVSKNQNYKIFSCIFCVMFLIEARKEIKSFF